ncbi:MAG: hypothetical protein M1821_009768 [Bathelium mastoideum]|nr:MAG: hypothetical protein M1821_009768 [Bathelium mastoideum]
MPPKKAAKATTAAASTRNAKPAPAATAASTRPKRASTTVVDEQPTVKKAKTGPNATAATKAEQVSTTKPKQASAAKTKQAKSTTPANISKRRGRPPKATKDDVNTEVDNDAGDESPAAKASVKKRGRPSKSMELATSPSKPAAKSASGRGRARTAAKSEPKQQADSDPGPSRGRGRPPSQKPHETTAQTTKSGPGRKKRSAATKDEDEIEANGHVDADEPTPKRKRGRPSIKSADANLGNDETTIEVPAYWLLKAEPESRLEKGIDVKFSIDDLRVAKEPEPWNGVRNHVAKNNMKAMKKGEQAFFYHSNCKTPGIVGIMEIVEEATPDESAFDEKDPYYDPKAKRDNPTGWVIVRVEFRQKFDNPITLDQLKALAKDNEEIADMQLLKQSRLSVSKVSPAEWNFILKQVEAGDTLDQDGDEAQLSADQQQVHDEDAKSTLLQLASPTLAPKSGARATSVPAPDAKLAPPKKARSRASSRARSVPPPGPTAESGPAGSHIESPVAQAMAHIAEEPET